MPGITFLATTPDAVFPFGDLRARGGGVESVGKKRSLARGWDADVPAVSPRQRRAQQLFVAALLDSPRAEISSLTH